MFKKGEFCGVCKQSKQDLPADQNTKRCTKCKVARYCSRECQIKDLPNHKADCKNVAHFLKMLPKIEEKFQNWNWSEHQDYQPQVGDDVPDGHKGMEYFKLWAPPKRDKPENLFKTILGEFGFYNKVNNSSWACLSAFSDFF